jgi:hypothetical protein
MCKAGIWPSEALKVLTLEGKLLALKPRAGKGKMLFGLNKLEHLPLESLFSLVVICVRQEPSQVTSSAHTEG